MADRIGLSILLKQVFTTHYQSLFALIFFEISEAQPLYLFPSWAEATALQAHLYFEPQRRCEQTAHFLTQILALERSAKQQTFQIPKAAKQYLSKRLKGASHLFRVTSHAGQIEIVRKPRTLSRRMANMGSTIMLTNQPALDPTKILHLYRHKDSLEKLFDTLNNEFDGKRLRGSTKYTVEGRLFLKFQNGNEQYLKNLISNFQVLNPSYQNRRF
jgi:hypothetical protein